MTMSTSTVRRAWVALWVIAAVTAALGWWWRRADRGDGHTAPPEWPPLAPDLPVASDPAPGAAWVAGSDGPAPAGHPVKAKDSSGIFHEPGGRFYDRTRPDRWYATAEAAEADGYRRSKT
jgi:hypothetical protein